MEPDGGQTTMSFMRPYKGLFRNWKMYGFHAVSPDSLYSLWIANGFLFFHDENKNTFLAGLPLWKQWLLWRELKHARREQAEANLAACLNEVN
jgi:hypothetical protein